MTQPTTPGAPPDVYRSVLARVIWWVWVVFALANVLDLAIQGHNHFSLAVAVILVLITGVSYAAAFRPRVVADDQSLLIQNPLRDHRVPWGCVDSLELGDSLEVRCRWDDAGTTHHRKLYAWSVSSPRRTRVRAEARADRKLRAQQKESGSTSKISPEVRAAMAKSDAEHILDSLRARGDKARAAGAAGGRPVSRWDPLTIAAIVLPALAVIVVLLT